MSLRILVIDDERSVGVTLRDMLETLGHTVVAVQNATDALVKARSKNFDVAIVDVNLGPGIDGISLTRELRHRFGLRAVIISGFLQGTLKDFASEAADAVLAKPFVSSQMEEALARIPLRRDLSAGVPPADAPPYRRAARSAR
ncbi:response regulator [Roseiterribacter gracilis]